MRILDSPGPELEARLETAPAVLFDFDGVLVDSEPLHYEAYRIVFDRLGHRLDLEEYWRHWTDLGEGAPGEIARHGLAGVDPDEVMGQKREIFDAWAAEGRMPLRPGAAALLEAFAASSVPASIASNTVAETIRSILGAAGIDPVPIAVVGKRPELRKKPHPDIFLAGAAGLGVKPAGCLVVEDARKGVEAAVAAGMEVVILRNRENGSFDYPEAAFEIERLELLREALFSGRRAPRGSR